MIYILYLLIFKSIHFNNLIHYFYIKLYKLISYLIYHLFMLYFKVLTLYKNITIIFVF